MFAGVLSAAAQQDTVRTQAPDNDAILRETINSASPYYYPTLFTRYLTGDTTLTNTDYRYLYYGFVWRPEYKPFETPAARDKILQILEADSLNEADYRRVIAYGNEVLKKSRSIRERSIS